METRIYNHMDWTRIEALVYSEENRPREILGPHDTEDGILITAFVPGAKSIRVRLKESGKEIPMIREDEEGFFACLLEEKKIPPYVFLIQDDKEEVREAEDPYRFASLITEDEEKKFAAGRWFDAGTHLGAHPAVIDGCAGTSFALWAPNALRVSVVGDFNGWDGRALPMNKRESGIFELFVPGVGTGDLYKYELKLPDKVCYLKSDPYALEAEEGLNHASRVADLSGYHWKDQPWMHGRKALQAKEAPLLIYSLQPSVWARKFTGEDFSYKKSAKALTEYVSGMGFTHVEFTPLMEYPEDASAGFETSGYFAPTARYGSPKDFMYLVDQLHQAGIGVLMDWTPGFFAEGNDGLAAFDGTNLYEHLDPKKGRHAFWKTRIFNNACPEVSNYLIAAALFWLEYFHLDGLRTVELASMLYLDYGRTGHEWIANIYGGNENLESIDFIRRMNTDIKEKYPEALLIAEDTSGWPEVTGSAEENGLGYDYVWNFGWQKDYLDYIQLDPYFRGAHQDDLTLSFEYAFSEKYLLPLSDDPVSRTGTQFARHMPGAKEEIRLANLRLSMAYMIVHPGKKMVFSGVETGETGKSSYDEKGLLLQNERQKRLADFTRELAHLYKSQPALFAEDQRTDSMEWISNLDARRNLLIFLRQTKDKEQTLLVVCNFSNVQYDKFRVGVPYPGKYKEIFNSDADAFGGTGAVNPRVKISHPIESDERKHSVLLKIAPLSVEVYRYSTAVKPVAGNARGEKTQKDPALKTRLEADFYQAEEEKSRKLQKKAGEPEKSPMEQRSVSARKTSGKNSDRKPPVKKSGGGKKS